LVFLKLGSFFNLILRFFGFIYLIKVWFFRIYLENKAGYHNFLVKDGFKYGFFLFLLREFMFFFGIFWFFFDVCLNPNIDFGNFWNVVGLEFINPFGLPLLNTFLLLGRARVLTYSHNLILKNKKAIKRFLFCLLLGLLFLVIQILEYKNSFFCFGTSVFGSIFF
jgi:cytochrome c oxidase subunit III